jgi:hypothetical protein
MKINPSFRFKFLLLFPLILLFAACATDPRQTAAADRTQALTAQDVADREQQRALDLQNKSATIQAEIDGQIVITHWASITVAFGLSFVLLALTGSFSYALFWSSRAWRTYINQRAIVQAARISMPKSGSFDYIFSPVGHNRYFFHDPNTGFSQVIRLNLPSEVHHE